MNKSKWTDRLLFKARQLNFLFAWLILILIGRIFFLTVWAHDQHQQRALKMPQRVRTIKVPRARIEDKNGLALAYNKPVRQLLLSFKPMQKIPSIKIERNGFHRIKLYPRQEYIGELCQFLSQELKVPAFEIKDFIYSQVAINPDTTHCLIENLSLQSYIYLKSQQHKWPGMECRVDWLRTYRYGEQTTPIAAHILGYMGWMNPRQWRKKNELKQGLLAQLSIEEDEAERLRIEHEIENIEGRMYGYRDYIGKEGLEQLFEPWLRGVYGTERYEVNAYGQNTQQNQSLKKPIEGRSLRLSIDWRLQAFCQKLLAQSQKTRDKWMEKNPFVPWIKPGAILVMEPDTGRILSMASYPNYDPNDFSQDLLKRAQEKKWSERHRWLEDEHYIAYLWDGLIPLRREIYNQKEGEFEWEEYWPNWEYILTSCAGYGSDLIAWFSRINDTAHIYELTKNFHALQKYFGEDFSAEAIMNFLFSSPNHKMFWSTAAVYDLQHVQHRWDEIESALGLESVVENIKKSFEDLHHNGDKLLAIELSRLIFEVSQNTATNFDFLKGLSIDRYRDHSKAYGYVSKRCKELAKIKFKETQFQEWRKAHQKAFLKGMRRKERIEKQFPRPYIVYLDRECERQFDLYWQGHGFEIMQGVIQFAAVSLELVDLVREIRTMLYEDLHHYSHISKGLKDYIEFSSCLSPIHLQFYNSIMKDFKSLKAPLFAQYPRLRTKQQPKQKDLARLLSSQEGIGYTRNLVLQESLAPGSIFKLVVSYEALSQRYLEGARTWQELNPLKIYDQKYPTKSGGWIVAKDENGKPIPQIYEGGRIPRSQRRHIGSVDLLGALENSSNPYFSLLASKFLKDSGQDLYRAAYDLGYGQKSGIQLKGEKSGYLPTDLNSNKTGLYTAAIGQHELLATPLQTAVMLCALANQGYVLVPQIVDSWYQDGTEFKQQLQVKRTVYLPETVREYILEGMRRVVTGSDGKARFLHPISCPYGSNEYKAVKEMSPYIVGKTSTAEVNTVLGVSPSAKLGRHCHVWFGAISFKDPIFTENEKIDPHTFQKLKPELVVVALYKYGNFGREVVPVCHQVVQYYKYLKSLEKSD